MTTALENLEHHLRFSDGSAMTTTGTINDVMEAVIRRNESRRAITIRTRFISSTDVVLGIGSSDIADLDPRDQSADVTRSLLAMSIDRARRNKYSREHPRPDLGVPLWEVL